jgi:superfamily I DNA and RNA helicase
MIIDARRVQNLEKTLLEIYAYWRDHADERNKRMSGQSAIKALVELIMPTRMLGQDVSIIFERERKKIDELTRRQFYLLNVLRQHRRAIITGGAGTGKTMLAMEKAKQLANANFRVLFLAYNRNITQWIAATLRDENITVATFHSFARQAAKKAGVSIPRDGDTFFQQAGDLLIEAAEWLRANEPDQLYDALIVDEAQDFEEAWWIALTEILRSPDHGVMYVFLDDNQQLYDRTRKIPIETEPLILSDNCRNTRHIHATMRAYAGHHADETTCEGPEGRPIEIIEADTPAAQRDELKALFGELVHHKGVRAEDIVVLTISGQERSQWREGDALGKFILTWDLETTADNAIRVSTIHSYKGLETAVVILTELDKLRRDSANHNQLLYVGMSRARHDVYIIGHLPKPI